MKKLKIYSLNVLQKYKKKMGQRLQGEQPCSLSMILTLPPNIFPSYELLRLQNYIDQFQHIGYQVTVEHNQKRIPNGCIALLRSYRSEKLEFQKGLKLMSGYFVTIDVSFHSID